MPFKLRDVHPKFTQAPTDMLKRVEKRRRKKEEEEKLGLDDDMKDILGLQDTDSDESDSDSDRGSEGSSGDGSEGDEGEDVGSEDEEANARRPILEESEEETVNLEGTAISIREALHDPIFIVSVQPDIQACIVCPRKLLKNTKMTAVHRSSKASHSLCPV